LSARVKILEDLLRQHGVAVPPMEEDFLSLQSFELKRTLSEKYQKPSTVASDSSFDSGNVPRPLLPRYDLDSSRPGMSSGWVDPSHGLQYSDVRALVPSDTPSLEQKWRSNSVDAQASFMDPQGRDNTPPYVNFSPAIDFKFQGSSYGGQANGTGFEGPESSASTRGDSNLVSSVGSMGPPATNALLQSHRRRMSSASWHGDEWIPNRQIDMREDSGSPKEVSKDDEIVDQLAARMGSFQIAEDGQLRYFGATSNLHIVHNGQFSLSRTPARSMRAGGEEALNRAGLAIPVRPEVEYHLEQLYFSWEDPSIHVVDEEAYYEEKNKWESGQDGSPFYSQTLKNAILAIGANLNSCPHMDLPQPTAEFFQSRAKAILEVEMDSPTVATVQALVIMSATEAAYTRDARGWLYSGMAVRLSADLGLHLDLSEHVREGKLTARDLDVRRKTFWGVFIHDNMWSLYVGRPWGITLRDISVARPSEENSGGRRKFWKPVIDPTDNADLIYGGLRDPIDVCTDHNISLAEMMSRLSRTL
jgi:hypothetical protein